jgi:predicted aspartyl protease
MRKQNCLGGIAAFCLLIFYGQVRANERCQLLQAASIDMGTDRNGGVFLPIRIAGHDENLLVDTGGTFSMLTPTVVDGLGLRRRQISTYRLRMYLFGGVPLTQYAEATGMQLGNLNADRLSFIVMPDNRLPSGIAGTIAPDIMRSYDVEFDFAKGKFNLFSHDHCKGQVVYWTHDPYAQVSMHTNLFGQITVPVVLDGQKLNAVLDTGSSRSVVRMGAAKDIFGALEKAAGLKPLGSPGKDNDSTEYQYPFHALTLEGIEVLNPDIVVVPDKMFRGGPDLIMGMGILRQLHLYLAYDEHNIYATAVGAH